MRILKNIFILERYSKVCVACARAVHSSIGKYVPSRLKGFSYESHYNVKEQNQILQTLNKSSAEELAKFDITRTRIERIQKFRSKCGPFHNLNQVLEVEGLGVKILERLCDSIIGSVNEQKKDDTVEKSDENCKKIRKRKTRMVTPSIATINRNTLKRVIGLHIAGNAVSWANLTQEGELLHWDLLELPFGVKNQHPITLFEMAVTVKHQLPQGDVYVMEDARNTTLQSAQLQLSSQQFWQLRAMLLTLLNSVSNPKTNSDEEVTSSPLYLHRVFFLRSQLPARLFQTLVGSEKVSAQMVVAKILDRLQEADHYSPITVDSSLKLAYMARTNVEKELLCEALLLTMSFMDLIIHMKPESIKCATHRS